MNPFSILEGAGSGSGGFSGSSSASADGQSGPATGSVATGSKVFNLGATNPNTVGGVISNPVVLVALVAGVYLLAKR